MFISHDVFPEIQTFEVVDHTFRFPLRTLYEACIKDDCEIPFTLLLESSLAVDTDKVKMTKWSGDPLKTEEWVTRELTMTASLSQGSFKWKTRVSKFYKFRVINAKHYTLYSRTHTPDLPWSSSFTLHEQWMFYDVSDDRGTSMRLVLTGGVEIHGNWFKDVIRRNGEFVLREVLTDFVVQMLTKLRPLKEKLRRMQLEQAERQLQQLTDNMSKLSQVVEMQRESSAKTAQSKESGALVSPTNQLRRQSNLVMMDSFDEPMVPYDSDELPPNQTQFDRKQSSSMNLNDYITEDGSSSTPKLRPLSATEEPEALHFMLSDIKPPTIIPDYVPDFSKSESISIERQPDDPVSCLSRRLRKLHENLLDFKVKGDQLSSEISEFMNDVWTRRKLKKRTSTEMEEEAELDRMVSLKKRKITLALKSIEQKSRDLAEAGVRDRIIDVAIQSVKYQLNSVDPPSKDNFRLLSTPNPSAPPFLETSSEPVPKERPCVIS